MLYLNKQEGMTLSKHAELYDILIDKDDEWRLLNEMVDFSFITDMLRDKYSLDMGRPAEDIERMFKYLLLKNSFKLSDERLVKRTKTDLLFKYFLGYVPEETQLIDPSLLTKFRRQRIGDIGSEDDSKVATNLMDELIKKTVEIAKANGIIEEKVKIITDSTHSNALYSSISPREELIRRAKDLRKMVYKFDESYKDKMPKKRENTGILEDQMEYTKELLKLIKLDELLVAKEPVLERVEYLEEMLDDTNDQLEYSKEQDARVGHKTADTSFFGYKTHLAMTPERIITGAVITSGEKHDGKELQSLVEKTERIGLKVEAVIGDTAYSEADNIKYCEQEKIKLASKLSKMVTHGNSKRSKEFEYNKDAEMYVCPAGHMAIKKAKQGSKNPKQGYNTQVECYYFDIEKCKKCPLKEGCYKEGSKTKTYSVTIKSDIHIKHMDYMETEEFQKLYEDRYKIEAKNGELKNSYGYDKANGCGKLGMTIQGASTLFIANMKRIIKLKAVKKQNTDQI